MRGAIKRAYLQTIEEENEFEGLTATTQMLFDDTSAIGSVTVDVPNADGGVYCLQVASAFSFWSIVVRASIVILLAPTGVGRDDEFRRLGVAVLFKQRDFRPNSTLRPTLEGRDRGWLTREKSTHGHSLENWFDDAERSCVTII